MYRIGLLPPLHEEETIASYLSRSVALGSYQSRQLLGALLGARWRRPDPLLPRGLRDLVAVTDQFSGFPSLVEWRSAHTHFQYFSAAASTSRATLLAAQMDSVGLGALRPVKALSVAEWTNLHPRVCPECRQRDVDTWGYGYIRRIDVTHFITRCPTHGVRLSPLWSQRTFFHDESSRTVDDSLTFARLSASLLCLAPSSRRLEVLAQAHDLAPKTMPRAKRLASLAEHILDRFSAGFEDAALTSLVTQPEAAHRLAARVISERAQAFHPAIVAIVQMLHDDGARVHPELKQRARPRERCSPDPTYPRARELLSGGASVTATAKQLGVTVRFVRAVAREIGQPLKRRPKELLPHLYDRVVEMLTDGIPPKAVAVATNLSLSTIYRVRQDLAEILNQRDAKRRLVQITAHRRDWKAHLASSPATSSRTALRYKARALYAWLYRNDRAWLMESTSAVASKSRHINERRQSHLLDADVVPQLTTAARRLKLADGKPCRVTWSRILRAAGFHQYIRPTSMPGSTAAQLSALVESDASFVARRLTWAIDTLVSTHAPLQSWRVLKHCGLRKETVEASGIAVEDLIVSRLNGCQPGRLSSSGSGD